ncbi:MAG: 2-oxoacid:ferredoxin oxidoreductase subunit delta [Prevotella sp.]|nr:2-oxoacid:ferredoxin oxidoreductase subunit delta [Prevotella sp.]
MAKRIKEDEIQYTIDIETNKAQQEIRKMEFEIDGLRRKNKDLTAEMVRLEAQGEKNSKEWRYAHALYLKNNKTIKALTSSIAEQTKKIGVNYMTMNQLKKQAKQLQRQLDDTSKAISPERYYELEQRLKAINDRMIALRRSAKDMIEGNQKSPFMDFLKGTAVVKLFDILKDSAGEINDYISDSTDMAASIDGVSKAFKELDNPSLLGNLRKATKGTVNDMELMKAAVQAKDFRIPLQDLGKYLAFAQLKAQQTGQSVEYMTQSIVTGLGRQSKMILDNLGISAAEIDEKVAETGDFMKAVASIVENQLAAVGETYISAADRALQKTTQLQNAQLEMGQALLPLKEQIDDTYGSLKIGLMQAVTWLAKNKEFTAALTVAITGLSVAMTVLNTQFRLYVASTTAGKVALAGWTAVATTAKGITLLFAAAKATLTKNTIRATAAMKLFNKTCKANVYVAAATALIALGVAIYSLVTKNDKAKKSAVDFFNTYKRITDDIRQQNKQLESDAKSKVADEITRIKTLRKTINDSSESYSKRKAAIGELQKIVPGYHATLNGEGELYKKNTALINEYTKKLNQAAMAEAAYEKMKENNRKIIDARSRIDDSNQKIRNVKRNTQSKYGVDLDRMNIDDKGTVRYNDVHRDDNPNLLDERKMRFRMNAGDNADNIKANQDYIEKKTELVRRDEAIVSSYEEQNKKLEDMIKKSGGLNPKALESKFYNPEPTTDKVGKTQKQIFDNERKEEIDQRKSLYDESMMLLRQNLIEKKITKEQYDQQASAMEMAYTSEILDIEKKYTVKSKNLAIKDVNEKKNIVLNQQANEQKARRDFQQKTLEAMEKYYDNIEKLNEAGMTDAERQERDYQMQLKTLKSYYDAALEYAHQNGLDEVALLDAKLKAERKLQSDYEKKQQQAKLAAREKYGLVSDNETMQREMEDAYQSYTKGELTYEQYQTVIDNILEEHEKKRMGVLQQYGLLSDRDMYNQELVQLKTFLDQKMITEEQYEKAVQNLKRDSYKKQLDYYTSLFSNAFTALQDAEMAQVDAKYDAQIEAARQAGEDTTELENKKAQEKLSIEKKYADVNFAIKASQIIADTATSIMKAYADLGPIAGSVAAALMGITGAAQLAAANAEREKVKKMTLSGSSTATSGARVAICRDTNCPAVLTENLFKTTRAIINTSCRTKDARLLSTST